VSILTKSQTKVYGPKVYQEGGQKYRITATVRYDDQCGNGHNSFAITADIYRAERGRWAEDSFGCCHDEVARRFPELAPFLKWHGMTSEGPTHYVANTVYHARQHGATHAWVYYTGIADPLNLGGVAERLLGYLEASDAKKAEGAAGYRVEWDQKTVKVANFDYARSCAVWPEATDAELSVDPEALKAALLARAPGLCEAFRRDVEALGMVY
jgi:hypothetical protein